MTHTLPQAVDLAIDQLGPVRKSFMKRLMNRPKIREAIIENVALKLSDDERVKALGPEFGQYLGQVMSGQTGLMTAAFSIDTAKLEQLLKLIVEYLPQIIQIIMMLFA